MEALAETTRVEEGLPKKKPSLFYQRVRMSKKPSVILSCTRLNEFRGPLQHQVAPGAEAEAQP